MRKDEIKNVKILFKELGDMIIMADEFGNDHNGRKEMREIYNRLKDKIDNLDLFNNGNY